MIKVHSLAAIYLYGGSVVIIFWLIHCIQMGINWSDILWQLVVLGTIIHSMLMVVGAFALVWGGQLVYLLRQQRHYQRDSARQQLPIPAEVLLAIADICTINDVVYYNDLTPFAGCAGIWHPRIYLSRGIVELLPPDNLRAVLAHEEAHRRQRDTLVYTLAVTLKKSLPLPMVRHWLEQIIIHIEIRADRFARQQTSTRALASALYQMLLLHVRSRPPQCEVVAFSGTQNSLDLRLQALALPLIYPAVAPAVRSHVSTLVALASGVTMSGLIVAALLMPILRVCLLMVWS